MSAQQYEELVVAVSVISYGAAVLWWPDTFHWPHGPTRKRGFSIFAIIVGAVVGVHTVLGA